MRGKVKYVSRAILYRGNKEFQSDPDIHPVRYTNTYAVLYNDHEVDIDEDEIREFFGRKRITNDLINKLSNDLHNVWIEYSEDDEGGYSFDDDLEDLI